MANPEDNLDELRAQLANLTARVYRLESQSGLLTPKERPSESQPTTQTPPPSVPRATEPPAAAATPPAAEPHAARSPLSPPPRVLETGDLEKKIGQYWLNRIGIIAVLIGVSYFVKLAFESNWVGPAGRILIGLVAGTAVILWSERFRSRGHAAFSYSLKAIGIGTLYLSLWGAFQVYHLIPSAAAFAAMIVVTAATIALAWSQDAQLLASFALAGGFSTPILLSTGQNHEIVLFSYVCILDLAILALAMLKPWRRLLWGSFIGTTILYIGWYSDYFTAEQRALTVFFAALFAAIFAAIPLATPYHRSARFPGPSTTLTLLTVLNAGVFSIQLFFMYADETKTLTWYALALAAAYLGIASAFKRRFPGQDTQVVHLLHLAVAVAFITIAIPLRLEGHAITIGWLVESAAILWVSVRTRTNFLRYLAVVALILGIFRLLFMDNFGTPRLLFTARFGAYLVAIAVMAAVVVFGKRYAAPGERPLLNVAAVSANVLALIALTLEAADYFAREMAAIHYAFKASHQWSLARDFSFSAIWLIYGAALMVVGFRRRSAFVRWQSLILIAFTVAKVFIYDVSELGGSYRIASFIALGAVLLAISFIYQRDWLKLSSRAPEEPSPNTVSNPSSWIPR